VLTRGAAPLSAIYVTRNQTCRSGLRVGGKIRPKDLFFSFPSPCVKLGVFFLQSDSVSGFLRIAVYIPSPFRLIRATRKRTARFLTSSFCRNTIHNPGFSSPFPLTEKGEKSFSVAPYIPVIGRSSVFGLPSELNRVRSRPYQMSPSFAFSTLPSISSRPQRSC
jgi:hypothetical protein